jgi:hypothetical protein
MTTGKVSPEQTHQATWHDGDRIDVPDEEASRPLPGSTRSWSRRTVPAASTSTTRTHGDWRYAPFVGSPSTEAAIVVTHRDPPDEHLALCLGCETPLRPMVEAAIRRDPPRDPLQGSAGRPAHRFP